MTDFKLMAVVFGLVCGTALAMSPMRIDFDYPPLADLCLLQEQAAIDGVSASYPIGSVVRTKFGTWTCTKVVAHQSPVVTAGVWAQK